MNSGPDSDSQGQHGNSNTAIRQPPFTKVHRTPRRRSWRSRPQIPPQPSKPNTVLDVIPLQSIEHTEQTGPAEMSTKLLSRHEGMNAATPNQPRMNHCRTAQSYSLISGPRPHFNSATVLRAECLPRQCPDRPQMKAKAAEGIRFAFVWGHVPSCKPFVALEKLVQRSILWAGHGGCCLRARLSCNPDPFFALKGLRRRNPKASYAPT